jgi:hypothetical protein
VLRVTEATTETMSENTYAELLLPGESKKRESREILSFRPRTMKSKTESNCGNGSPVQIMDGEIKRQKLDENNSVTSQQDEKPKVTFRASEAVAEPRHDEDKVVTVLTALEKISLHLMNNKKFLKAVKLLSQLIESSMDDSNGNEFFLHLANLMKNCPVDRDITSPAYAQAYIDLITLYRHRKDRIRDPSHRYELETFYILVCLRASLATDDSYTFNKACSELKAIIIETFTDDKHATSSSSSSCISSSDQSDKPSVNQASAQVLNRENAIFVCLETAFRLYHWSWAKQPCDTVYACAAERRLHFSDDSRESLDTLTMAITAAQRKDSSWSGPQTIRTYNSTAHPLLTKNVGILR